MWLYRKPQKLDVMRYLIRLLSIILAMGCGWQAHAQWMTKTISSDDLYKMAKRDIDLKRYQKAINECRLGLNESPKNMDLHLLLGRAYSLAGKLDSARDELNYVRERNPRYRDVYIYLVNLEAVACNYQQAIEYADEGLKYFPNDRDLLLKKLDIYIKQGDWVESDRMAAYIFDHYSSDPYVRSIYIEYKLSLARHYYTHGFVDIALRAYESVLEQDPMNKEALDAIYNLDVKTGNYAKSLTSINRALLANPNSYELLMKKLAILEAMSLYIEAIDIADKLQKLYPGNGEVIRTNAYIRIEAGRYYMKQDPLLLFESVLDKEPTNMDALTYVINISYSRGLLPEALQWVNQALRRAPGSRELLLKKLGILESMENWGQAASVAEMLYKSNPTQQDRDHLLELKNLSARSYMADDEYDSAIVCLNTVLSYDKSNMQAVNYLITIYSTQKKWDEALRVVDEGLKSHPDNEGLTFRKVGVLDGFQRYNDAAALAKVLMEKYPKNKRYVISFIEEILAAGRQSMQFDEYYASAQILRQALDAQPFNIDALNYMINLETAVKQYDSALYYVNQALTYYPNSKDFKFKQSIVYAEAREYRSAYEISGALYRENPFNNRFRSAYVEQLLASGKQYLNNNVPDSALVEFNKAMAVAPNDTLTMYYTIALLNDGKEYDKALELVAKGRRTYPLNTYFILKRANIMEAQKNYLEAWKSMDTLSKMGPMEQKYIDYKELLFSKTLVNEIGLLYLNSTFDPQTTIGNNSNRRIATLQYSHKYDKGVVTLRMNYAGRITGSGFQYQIEGTRTHSPKWYSYGVFGYSDNPLIFPKVMLGYSLFHSMKRSYDIEVGGRYSNIDSDNTYSALAAISKEKNDFYFTGKGFLTELTNGPHKYGPYPSLVLSSRYYVNDLHSNFFSAFVGYGNAPDDLSRILEYANYQNQYFTTVSVGAGYQMVVHYRTTLVLSYTWYNIEFNLKPVEYRNQYDLFMGILHKF